MKSALVAVQFLTRIPVPRTNFRTVDLGFSLLWYPLVGAGIGAFSGLPYRYGFWLWPDPVGVLLILGVMVWLKDTFHLDGLSDFIDGIYGGDTPEEIYTIMKDPALGPFGTFAIVSVLALEYAVLLTLSRQLILPVLIGILALATGTGALLIVWSNPVKKKGLASSLMDQRRNWFGPVIVLGMVLISFVSLGLVGLLLMAVSLLMARGLSWWYEARIGGVNGDCCGATIMIVQTVLFLLVSLIDHLQLLPFERGFGL